MIPLDGGYILKESVERIFERRGLAKYATFVTTFMSTLMVAILISLIILPYLFTITAV
jgi:membrane-associated protease RseP (regulator of RpoE activity)